MNKFKKKIFELINKINYFNYNYYILSKSLITDEEYDFILNKLKLIKKKYNNYILDNFLNKNNLLYNKFNKFNHLSNMLSLKNTYKINDLILFEKKIKKNFSIKNIKYCCEEKLDGVAINLIYKNCKLFKILTRGNGVSGEDITHNIKYINNIPNIIKNKYFYESLIEIRGEVCISKENFKKINKTLEKNNKKKFINCRSASSGIIRNNKNIDFYKNILNFISYGFGYNFSNINNNKFYKSNYNILKKIKYLGFKIPKNIKLCNNIYESIDFCKFLENNKKKFKYEIDGLVIKIDSIDIQNKLKNSKKYPNWSIAYKFFSEYKITKILDIEYNVGRTGLITPIAILEPVIIFGMLIKKVFLYNLNQIYKLNLNIGDLILIKLSGNIIPKIESKINNINNNKIIIINKCPSCKNVIKNINLKKLICENGFLCKSQIKYKILHFFSKNCININIEKNILIKLIKNKLIKNPIDIFKINLYDLKKIKLSYELTKKIINLRNIKIKVKLYKFIYSLSINNIGIKSSIKISKNINNIYNLLNNCFIKKNNISENIINNITIFLNNKNNKYIINKLLKKYIIITNDIS